MRKDMNMAEIDIEYINDMAENSPAVLVRSSEENYHAMVEEVAEKICSDKNVRILLLAGPSGSGKTTTANLISDRIKSHGEGCIVVSLDDFYLNFDDGRYPRLENGELDCESPLALDIPLLNETLLAIAHSEKFSLPKYNFKVSRRTEMRPHEPMPNGCVIIEGLHALNPLVFSPLPKESTLKLFISVSTNVFKSSFDPISSSTLRMPCMMVVLSLLKWSPILEKE